MSRARTEPPVPRRAAALGVSYRPAGEADRPFLLEVYASTRRAEVAQTGWPEAECERFLAMQASAQDSHYRAHYPDAVWLVVEIGGRAAGRLYLEAWEAEHRLIDIALLPGERGRGAGAAILSDLQEDAARAGKALTIHVEKTNPARRLYDRLGFRSVADKGVYDLLEWRADQVKTAS